MADKLKGQRFSDHHTRVGRGDNPLAVAVDFAEALQLGALYSSQDISARIVVAPDWDIEDRYRRFGGETMVPVYTPFVDNDYNDFTARLTRKIREIERSDVRIVGIAYRIADKGKVRIVSDGWIDRRTKPWRLKRRR